MDLVPDLSTSCFIRCLKRFTARQGIPVKIVSDNGKTFKAAAKFLQSIVNHHDVQQHVSGLEYNGCSTCQGPHGGAKSLNA